MNKTEFVEGVLEIFDSFDSGEVIYRKKLALEELSECGAEMPNVKYVIDNYIDFPAACLRMDSDFASIQAYLNLEEFDREEAKKYAENFYDSFITAKEGMENKE